MFKLTIKIKEIRFLYMFL